jgi:hypothetical protein
MLNSKPLSSSVTSRLVASIAFSNAQPPQATDEDVPSTVSRPRTMRCHIFPGVSLDELARNPFSRRVRGHSPTALGSDRDVVSAPPRAAKHDHRNHEWVRRRDAVGMTMKGGSSALGVNPYLSCLRHPAVFITKGLPPPGPLLIHTLFDCRYPSIASAPFSRPRPEAL